MYIDLAYIKNRIGTDRFVKLCGTDLEAAAMLPPFINAAQDIVNSYIARVTTVPLAAPGDAVKDCTLALTVFLLHDRIQYQDIPEWVKLKRDSALDYLNDISRRNAVIQGIPLVNDEGLTYTVDEPRL